MDRRVRIPMAKFGNQSNYFYQHNIAETKTKYFSEASYKYLFILSYIYFYYMWQNRPYIHDILSHNMAIFNFHSWDRKVFFIIMVQNSFANTRKIIDCPKTKKLTALYRKSWWSPQTVAHKIMIKKLMFLKRLVEK